ncbi:hypothetical protein GPL17_05375 [Bradyrhizobium yuanmingense]|nr:hypothetical protein [Bradyrhizobium yuanmingense]
MEGGFCARRCLILRHCEEPLRRSNPGCLRGGILDCFATLAMTWREWWASLATSRTGPANASWRTGPACRAAPR